VVAGGERTSRFMLLQSLRRQALVKQNGLDASPLSDAEWLAVLREIEEVLICAYRRRLLILARAQTTFEKSGYNWQVVDERLRMYKADKKALMPRVIVLSHCSVHDITYLPALKAYWDYLKSYKELASVNQRLCIYDRDRVLSQAEIETLISNVPEMNVIVAHYNELELLVASNFTTLRP
jgi:hypothetical protein